MERLRKWAVAIQVVALLLVLGVLIAPRGPGEARAPGRAPPSLVQAAPVPGTFSPLTLPRQEPGQRPRRTPPRDVRAVAETDPIRPPDLTRFQRRLLAGSRLMKIHEHSRDPRANLQAFAEQLATVRPALLRADRIERYSLDFGRCGRSCWETITGLWIKCRPEIVKLSSGFTGASLGRGAYIRVWTLGERYPRAEIAAAEKLLRHLESVTGARIGNGFDVIATRRRGDEVLPLQGGYDWAVGTYYTGDEYSTVKTDLFPRFRAEVLQHELIHAFCRQFTEDFISSRFISEGLAEYLRFLEPGDEGLRVPPERMANNFARLLEKVATLRGRGVDIDRLQPPRLLELSPGSFYAIHEIGYPLALAAMAYVGGGPIERAFQERSDGSIAEAVGAIRWEDLLGYVEAHARDGDPHKDMTVPDGKPEEGEPPTDPSEDPEAVQTALESLGVAADSRGPIDSSVLDFRPEGQLTGAEPMASLLELLLAHHESLFFFADRSDAVLEPFHLAEEEEGLAGPFTAGALRAPTRAAFIRNLHDAFGASGGEDAVPLLGLSEEPLRFHPARLHAALPFTASGLPGWLASAGSGPAGKGLSLILCIAGRDEAAREEVRSARGGDLGDARLPLELEEHYFGRLRSLESSLRAALVIDLSNGKGDALPLARALARTKHFRGLIGYWDPQKGN